MNSWRDFASTMSYGVTRVLVPGTDQTPIAPEPIITSKEAAAANTAATPTVMAALNAGVRPRGMSARITSADAKIQGGGDR